MGAGGRGCLSLWGWSTLRRGKHIAVSNRAGLPAFLFSSTVVTSEDTFLKAVKIDPENRSSLRSCDSEQQLTKTRWVPLTAQGSATEEAACLQKDVCGRAAATWLREINNKKEGFNNFTISNKNNKKILTSRKDKTDWNERAVKPCLNCCQNVTHAKISS